MKLTKRNIHLAWKYRGMLWRYRHAIRRRKQIGGMLAAGAALGLGMFLWRRTPRAPISEPSAS